jgi:hypothetical protein
MTKARIIAAAIAALVAAPATHAQDAAAAPAASAASPDGAWNSPYGLIFSVQNLFQNGSSALIGDYGGGIGIQKNLSAKRALRVSVNLARASDSGYETETTNLATGQVTKSYTPPGPFTSRYDVNVGAMYEMRLTAAKIAPYLGVGGGVNYLQQARQYEDDVSSTVTTFKVDNMYRATSLFASGTFGLEWRVASSVSLFAEYGIGLDLVTWQSNKTESRTTVNATGAVSGSKSEGSTTTYLNWSTGLVGGGQLGLVAFF